jgi:hypothetical protein
MLLEKYNKNNFIIGKAFNQKVRYSIANPGRYYKHLKKSHLL